MTKHPSMGPSIIHLPDGQNFTVTPVFAGLFFKSHELSTHANAFPIGWTIVLHTEDEGEDPQSPDLVAVAVDGDGSPSSSPGLKPTRKTHIHSFSKPTLQNDNLFISSISNPSSNEFKPATSPTRQIAMMLWITLYWYFHQPAPSTMLPPTESSSLTPQNGKPRGEWRINIKRDGVLRGKNLIPKLERMGLITTLDSAVGTSLGDKEDGWTQMYVSRQMFWQTPGRLFLFTLQPNPKTGSYPGSPASSRPGSPMLNESPHAHSHHSSTPQSSQIQLGSDLPGAPPPQTLITVPSFPIGPFFSTSHLPTYYPPPPLQYTITNGIRHPVRPKPPRMGEVFYTRFVPSVGQYLSFRVASASPNPVPYLGPVGPKPPTNMHLSTLNDTGLLQMWLSNPRVSKFWGSYVPTFLTSALSSRHSFPAIGMWDGVPFGYFEIYWAKEDILGTYVGSEVTDWDRGVHVFIGEEWARGRVQSWLTSLVHWILTTDYRTMTVCMEPRVDNARWVFLQAYDDSLMAS
ncbi:putative aerobactin siderophore biosynthesis protein iucb protein [Phaeoacremonium minimum UCRPA7]|uniref:Putative aerobactin siderophore biosynthesis protein iucb protein n=1 Tax=Phaeoacremonium minimum (strain UCR-PA7) TaxID=1286976 RepID=R8B8I6_PHAM7|nr:putative aerobactin siderophore biosynthesis protein iucb protein [Phaeoacremonium minimum UCRPA7]EON95620.1 putative aerobactin siderophore biosynthesis protein iucb protein [Phaeoacremonium minimum UCRPA7]